MTFSILAYDAETGRYGGAAATGSLCVGGWVLRGRPDTGMSASQGTAPSTLWGEDVLTQMQSGAPADQAVRQTVQGDTGRAFRQLAALDPMGRTAAFTGDQSVPACGHRAGPDVIVAGNMLTDTDVLDAILDRFLVARGGFTDRLLAALVAGEAAGSDSRGLMSAALLVVGADMPPLTLRVDYSDAPLDDLQALHQRATSGAYGEWMHLVPTQAAPHRAPSEDDLRRLGRPANPADDTAAPVVTSD